MSVSSSHTSESLRFVSTRYITQNLPLCEKDSTISFVEAVFKGLADDGGLYYPTCDSDLSYIFEKDFEQKSFVQLAGMCTHRLFFDEFSYEEAIRLCAQAFSFTPRFRPLDDEITLLELFDGPSCAFKDFGAAYLAAVMEHKASNMSEPITVLTATSGDTGSAVAQAFFKKENVRVVLLYPMGRVSPLQEKQLTGLGENIVALEVRGSFDDCQRMVKNAFADASLCKKLQLTSANSINIGRLIPQSFYYMYAWQLFRDMEHSDRALFCVPSGNFGNLTAGLFAWRWGMPVSHFIAATNANRTVPHYLQTNIYKAKQSVQTFANAMDVGDPSNFERMRAMFHILNMPMRNILYGAWANDKQIAQTMRNVYDIYKAYVCPHTAAGIYAARTILKQKNCPYKHSIVLSTAHAGKFSEVVENICKSTPPLPQRLAVFLEKQKNAKIIDASSAALGDVLRAL